MYATQNLALLAWEYDLSAEKRQNLIDLFFDKNVNNEQFVTRALTGKFHDDDLANSISIGRIDYCDQNVLFEKDASVGDDWDLSTLLAYRDAAKRRQDIRRELEFDSASKLNDHALRAESMLRLFDQRLNDSVLTADSKSKSSSTNGAVTCPLNDSRAAS